MAVSMVVLASRPKDWSQDQFTQWWRGPHADAAKLLPGLLAYRHGAVTKDYDSPDAPGLRRRRPPRPPPEAGFRQAAPGDFERFGVTAIRPGCEHTDEASVEAAIATTVERLGGLDILINNAGASWWGLPQDIPLKG